MYLLSLPRLGSIRILYCTAAQETPRGSKFSCSRRMNGPSETTETKTHPRGHREQGFFFLLTFFGSFQLLLAWLFSMEMTTSQVPPAAPQFPPTKSPLEPLCVRSVSALFPSPLADRPRSLAHPWPTLGPSLAVILAGCQPSIEPPWR